MIPRIAAGYFLIALSTALSVHAAAYIGCIAGVPRTGLRVTGMTTNQACFASCVTRGYNFAYLQQNNPSTCFCSSTGQTYATLVGSEDAYGTCATPRYQAYSVVSTFQFQSCTTPLLGVAASVSTVTDFPTCFENCKMNRYALFTPALLSTNFQCNCYDSVPLSLTLVACQKGPISLTSFLYGHPAQFSGQAKRALKERLEYNMREERKALCPGRKTACSIPGAEDSFECIDIDTELESCGGCIYGTFNDVNGTASTGTDCSAVKGVGRGAITCSLGECVAYRCRPGWKLVKGICEKYS